jgi:hypothetical protein
VRAGDRYRQKLVRAFHVLFVKAIDGKWAGTWSSHLRKSVQVTPGQHTITIKYVFVTLAREMEFDLNVAPGHTYHCIGKEVDKKHFFITIQDAETGEVTEGRASTCSTATGRCM